MAKNEIQPTDTPQFESPIIRIAELVQQSNGKIDTAGMEKMMEMHFRYEADEAKKVFASDFAVAQSNIDAVVKTKVNPQTKSKYAGLEGVLEMAKPVYTGRGFSVIFYEGKAEEAENIRLCADVLHKAGHSKTYHLDVPLDGKGIKGNANMTKIHGKASSLTYGRRYLLCMIWNIPTQDDDGNGAGKAAVEIPEPNQQQISVISAICCNITPPPGKRVDMKKATAIFWERCQKYPADMSYVEDLANWLVAEKRPELFIPENRSQAEIDLGMPGDEDSRPDTEADKTAAAKFGEENEQQEAMYRCQKCGLEWSTPKEAAKCRC